MLALYSISILFFKYIYIVFPIVLAKKSPFFGKFARNGRYFAKNEKKKIKEILYKSILALYSRDILLSKYIYIVFPIVLAKKSPFFGKFALT